MAEYCCQFVDAAGAAFSGDDITALFAYDRTLVPPIAAQPRPKPSPGAVVVARHVQAMERRKLAAQVMRGRDQRRCPHLWRGGSCVHCALTKENWYELLRLTGTGVSLWAWTWRSNGTEQPWRPWSLTGASRLKMREAACEGHSITTSLPSNACVPASRTRNKSK